MITVNQMFRFSKYLMKTGMSSLKRLDLIPRRLTKPYCSLSLNPVNLEINNVPLKNYILHLEKEYNELKELNYPGSNTEKRLSELEPIINILQNRDSVLANMASLKDLFVDKDIEIRQLAKEEMNAWETQLATIDGELLEVLLPADKNYTRKSIMLEINAGVGGQEAMLFAKELFNMYYNFAKFKNWCLDIAEYLTTDIGGVRHASMLINGEQVYQYLQYEAGVHRVQRIPMTERHGRIHTSTISVMVLPQPTEIEINIDNKDLKFETKKASGAGGQHVNTTDSAVRVVHLPTGRSVECQVDRSQLRNKALAIQRLRTLLYEDKLKTQLDEIEITKKNQVKSNFRNEKIRTYNYSQDRITDHRLQGHSVHNLKMFLLGEQALETLINKLDKNERINQLLEIVNQIENN